MSDAPAPFRLRDTEEPVAPRSAFGNSFDARQRLRLVVDAAARRFEANGFHGTSLQQISDDVGITKAALYHYVNSKEQLLFMIHDTFVSTMIENAEAFLAEHDDPIDQIRFYVNSIFMTVTEFRPYVKAFFRDYGVLGGEYDTSVREKRHHYEKLVETSIKAGIDRGVFDAELDAHDAALFLFGACNWSFHWLPPNSPELAEQLAEKWSTMILKAFGVKPRRLKR